VQVVDNEASLPFVLHKASLPQYPEMVRDVDDGRLKLRGDFTYILWTAAQAADDSQPLRFGECTQ
jgi:hypothetical protein